MDARLLWRLYRSVCSSMEAAQDGGCARVSDPPLRLRSARLGQPSGRAAGREGAAQVCSGRCPWPRSALRLGSQPAETERISGPLRCRLEMVVSRGSATPMKMGGGGRGPGGSEARIFFKGNPYQKPKTQRIWPTIFLKMGDYPPHSQKWGDASSPVPPPPLWRSPLVVSARLSVSVAGGRGRSRATHLAEVGSPGSEDRRILCDFRDWRFSLVTTLLGLHDPMLRTSRGCLVSRTARELLLCSQRIGGRLRSNTQCRRYANCQIPKTPTV